MIRQRAHKPTGFTLVELMVALGLTIFLLALFTSLMVAATGSINTSQGIGAVDQQVRNAITILRDDLQHVYLANGGTQLKVSELFTDADKIPSKGYFMIEENDRAIRQGLDSSGLPVEVDFDDVLAFTAGNPAGTKREDFYYGRVYNSNGTSIQTPTNDLGNYLDNSFNDPVKFFDTPGNNLLSSRFAEIVYFLRANGRQYSVEDIRGGWPTGASPTIPPTPPTFTLYRRQLLVLENADRLNFGSTIAPAGIPLDTSPTPGNCAIPGRPSNNSTLHELFDISASRQFRVPANGAAVEWGFNNDGTVGTIGRIHFNTLDDLSQREYRYGMRLFEFDIAPLPRVLRAVPMSHYVVNGRPAVHNYLSGDPANPVQSVSTPVQWIGRPTQAETNHRNYIFSPPSQTSGNSNVDDSAPQNGVLDIADTAPFATRSGDDILLTNVVSFDVKVFEENAVPPSIDVRSYHAASSTAINPLDDVRIDSRTTTNPYVFLDTTLKTALKSDEAQTNSRLRRPDFVDLGNAYDRMDFLNETGSYPPATFWPGMNSNCKTTANYYYHPTLSTFGLPFNPADPLMNAASPPPGRFIDGPDGVVGGTPDDDFVTVYGAGRLAELNTLLNEAVGPARLAGRDGFDDDGDGVDDNLEEYMAPFSGELSMYLQTPYNASGQIGEVLYPWVWTNPRNTYDSWSSVYAGNPKETAPPTTPNPNFRPVPYPRPLKGIQIKLRVLEPKTGIVRDFTLRHYFD